MLTHSLSMRARARKIVSVAAAMLVVMCTSASAEGSRPATPAPASPASAGLTHLIECTVDLNVNVDGAPVGFLAEVNTIVAEIEKITGIDVTVRTDLTAKEKTLPTSKPGTTSVNMLWKPYDDGEKSNTYGLAYSVGTIPEPTAAVVTLNSDMLIPQLSIAGTHYFTRLVPGFRTGFGPVGVVNLVRHELGHVLGLPHSEPTHLTSTMLARPVAYEGGNAYSADAAASLSAGYAHCRS